MKKDAFVWSENTQQAFEKLKVALTTAPVLALPSWDKEFVVETDACDVGIGAVLMQESHPIAYLNNALAPKHKSLLVYEKELLAVVFTIKKWDHYLSNRHFLIKIDHCSLKFFLEQRMTTSYQ